MQYLLTAFKKFIFCFNISADYISFIKLLWFTKKYKWNKNRNSNNAFIRYNIILNKKKYQIYLRTYCGDIDIFYEIFFHELYQTPNIDSLSPVIFDIGANIGLAALFFLSRYPAATIISVEPDPANASILKKNLSSQIATGQVHFVEAAISNVTGKMFLSQPLLKYNSALIKNMTANAKGVSVFTMQHLIAQFSVTEIDILKLDVEGAEENIITQESNWLAKIKILIIEIHSSKAKENILNTLEDKNFHLLKPPVGSIHFFHQ